MKKNALYTVILSLSLPINASAMGLGDMKVHSYLGQMFSADIELIDVGNIPISEIRANLASAEEFERVGLDRPLVLSLLTFTVEKNSEGHPIIKVRSTARISEPYMQLLVDIAWSHGEVYRAYPIFLDPPNYKLHVLKKQLQTIVSRQNESQESLNQPGVIHRSVYSEVEHVPSSSAPNNKGASTYGPTVMNETVWQIAQRFKTEDVLLQQMILAIVGTNPDAFIEGNLNGLKEGSRLHIPASMTAIRVPVTLSKLEVLAHDKSWQSRQPIEHALLPPYIDSKAPAGINQKEITALGYPLSYSKIPVIPGSATAKIDLEASGSQLVPLSASLMTIGEGFISVTNGIINDRSEVGSQGSVPIHKGVATAAIDTVRLSNHLLIDQLRSLQRDNKQLQTQLTQRELELTKLREQIRTLILSHSSGSMSRGKSVDHHEPGMLWVWVFVLLGFGVGGSFIYRWAYKPISVAGEDLEAAAQDSHRSSSSPDLMSKLVQEQNIESQVGLNHSEPDDETIVSVEEVVSSEPLSKSTLPGLFSDTDETEASDSSDEQKDKENQHLLEFDMSEETATQASTEEQDLKLFDINNEQPESAGGGSSSTPKSPLHPQSSEAKNPAIEHEEIPPFELELIPVVEKVPDPVKPKPIKSKVAMDTLLDLAKTYLSMEDFEASKQSLLEVIEHGTKKQREEAQRLLDGLSNNNP